MSEWIVGMINNVAPSIWDEWLVDLLYYIHQCENLPGIRVASGWEHPRFECAPGPYRCLQQIFRPSLWCLNGSMGIFHGQVWEKQLGIVHKQLRVIWVFPMQPLLNGYWSLGWCTHHISPALFKVGTHFLFHHGFLNPGSNSWTFHPNFPFNMSISHGNILCFAAAGSMGSSVFTGHYWNCLWKWGANLPHFQVHTQLSYCWFMLVHN